jgi:pimeloyl-ACP methyl ester carboxylesterase
MVLALPCAMPVGIASEWLRALANRFYVITWETRGMFGLDDDFDVLEHGVRSQVADLHSLLEHFHSASAHLMGICGGAAIALAAASSERIASLSLWHGDFELGSEAPQTKHRYDLQDVMAIARTSRTHASKLHASFRSPRVLSSLLREELAHYLLYPYASAELLYRYGILNGNLMQTDCRPLLPRINKPVLVVTSAADQTTHPDGSRFVARNIAGSRLCEFSSQTHLSVFQAPTELVELAVTFAEDTTQNIYGKYDATATHD